MNERGGFDRRLGALQPAGDAIRDPPNKPMVLTVGSARQHIGQPLGRGTCRSLSVTMEVVDDERKVDRGDARNQRRLSHRSGGWAWP